MELTLNKVIKFIKQNWITIVIVIVALLTVYYFFFSFKHVKDIDKVYEIPNFLTPEECQHIIKLAEPNLKRSEVIAAGGSEVDSIRTSQQAWLNEPDDPVIKKISDLAIEYTGLPTENQEELQVLRYHKGQEYRPHYDACHPDKDSNCKEDIKKGGLRYATVIVYLNDSFEDGGTIFPNRNYTVKPKTGKVAIFYNLKPDNSFPSEKSLHGGEPVKNGTKWMCNFWIRLNKIP